MMTVIFTARYEKEKMSMSISVYDSSVSNLSLVLFLPIFGRKYLSSFCNLSMVLRLQFLFIINRYIFSFTLFKGL